MRNGNHVVSEKKHFLCSAFRMRGANLTASHLIINLINKQHELKHNRIHLFSSSNIFRRWSFWINILTSTFSKVGLVAYLSTISKHFSVFGKAHSTHRFKFSLKQDHQTTAKGIPVFLTSFLLKISYWIRHTRAVRHNFRLQRSNLKRLKTQNCSPESSLVSRMTLWMVC